MDEKTQLATMLLENIQRNELTLLEQAQGFQLMLDWGDSIKDVSEKTGLSETTVRRRVKIVKTFGKEAIERVQNRPIELGDYEKVYKIEDPEKRAEVFEEIGTKEFDWALNSALNAQDKEEKKNQLVSIVSGFATETSPEVYRSSSIGRYWHYYRYDEYEMEAVQKLAEEAEKPDGEFAGEEIFYKVEQGYSGVTIYIVNNEEADDSKVKAAQAEKERQEAHQKRIKAMFKQAHEMRIKFAKSFSATANDTETIHKMAALALFSQRNSSEDIIRALFGIEKKFRMSWETGEGETRDEAVSRILDKYNDTKNSGNFLFKGTYSRLEPGNVDCLDNSGNYRESDSLTQVYDYLTKLGYMMSDEEEMLIKGTHPVYSETAGDSPD